MFRRLQRSKAQSTAEYAVLIALVVGAVVAMQVYVRRGVQGRIRDVVDHTGAAGLVGEGGEFAFDGDQYEPYYLASEANTQRTAQQQEILGQDGGVGRGSHEQTRQDRQQVMGWAVVATDSASVAAVDGAVEGLGVDVGDTGQYSETNPATDLDTPEPQPVNPLPRP